MYSNDFVAGVLAGFEGALEALIPGVEDRTRDALVELHQRICTARDAVEQEDVEGVTG
jgi:hypothetical protein